MSVIVKRIQSYFASDITKISKVKSYVLSYPKRYYRKSMESWNANTCNCLLRYTNGIFSINDRTAYHHHITYLINELNTVKKRTQT